MSAGSMNTGRFGMRTGKRRFSSAGTACGIQVRFPMRRDGNWTCPIAIVPSRIAKAAVTNAEFAAFVDEGGYRRREFWSAPGWEWRERVAAEHPVYWLHNEGGSWTWRSHDKVEALPPHAPVTFVNW